ncbi:MAG: DUF2752 domain-containing protein [Acidimicrobiia bacterium]|nr:DUF2752 domain-containing protein [Acidimicrobiia bacterium]
MSRRVAAVPAAWLALLATAALAAGCLVLATVDPATSGRYPACPFYTVTGRWCPGCGTARGLHQLLNGRVDAALGYNPLLLVALPFLAYTFLAWALPALRGPRLPAVPQPARAVWTVLALVGVFWVARNLPWEPFAALAP